ncbi:hypothetical protein OHA21_16125 [Actinoplanes sp. NBC_00393]
MTADEDDPCRSGPACGEHRAEPDGAVAHDDGGRTGPDSGQGDGVGAGRQPAQQLRIGVRAHRDERRVGERHADRLGLASAVAATPEAAGRAGGEPAVAACGAGSVREGERGHDEVTRPDPGDGRADLLDDSDPLVSHAITGCERLLAPVGPQIGAAHSGQKHPHHGVIVVLDHRVGNVDDVHPAGSLQHRRLHGGSQ